MFNRRNYERNAMEAIRGASHRTKTAALTILLYSAAAPCSAFEAPPGLRAEYLAVEQNSGFSVSDLSGAPGQWLSVRINLPSEGFGEFSYVSFAGFPARAKFSAGFQVEQSWVVSLKDIPRLRLITDPGFAGSFQLEIALFRGRDDTPEKRVVSVKIQGKAVSEEEETAVLDRGGALLKGGDIAGARLLFGYLAGKSSAKGAFAMAQTYDPAFLNSLFIKGLQPNIPKAMEWYSKASELGHSGAEERLNVLSADL